MARRLADVGSVVPRTAQAAQAGTAGTRRCPTGPSDGSGPDPRKINAFRARIGPPPDGLGHACPSAGVGSVVTRKSEAPSEWRQRGPLSWKEQRWTLARAYHTAKQESRRGRTVPYPGGLLCLAPDGEGAWRSKGSLQSEPSMAQILPELWRIDNPALSVLGSRSMTETHGAGRGTHTHLGRACMLVGYQGRSGSQPTGRVSSGDRPIPLRREAEVKERHTASHPRPGVGPEPWEAASRQRESCWSSETPYAAPAA